MKVVRTTCTLDCFDTCSVLAHVDGDRLVRLQGDPEHPITQGFLCHKVSKYPERVYHKERLLRPLRRGPRGLEPVSWEEAIEHAAGELRRLRQRHGPQTLLTLRGHGSMGALKLLYERFIGLWGGASRAQGNYCAGEAELGFVRSFGNLLCHDIRDVLNSRSVILWGRNPAVTQIHLVPWLRKARKQGARVVLVDPVVTETSALADRQVKPRPGSDHELAQAVAALIVREEWVDRRFVTHHTEGFQSYRQELESVPLEERARRADVSVQEVAILAEALARRRPAALYPGIGLQQYSHGAEVVAHVSALAALTGNIGVPGGGVNLARWPWLYLDGRITGQDLRAVHRDIPVGHLAESIRTSDDPPITATFITAANPVAQQARPRELRQALLEREFNLVVEQFLTDTAECAHLVLPVTTFLEEEELAFSYGHFYASVTRPVIPPPGEVRTELAIYQALAGALGFGEGMAGTPADWVNRAVTFWKEQGWTYEALKQGYRLFPEAGRPPYEGGQFETPSGRFVFPAGTAKGPADDARFPLRLVSRATRKGTNSMLVNMRPAGLPVIKLHPETAARSGVAPGGKARLRSADGSVEVAVELDPRQRLDLVVCRKGGWWKTGHSMSPLLKNTFTPGGGVAYNETAVRLEPA
ncbi:MAG: molybdopterin-dependent oxidoreductase [Acidobacteriota bacterium]